MNDEALTAYISLFHGRVDCYGAWDGGCVKLPLTKDVFRKHLTTGPYIGVYPMAHDLTAWGCIDVDFDDLDLCRKLQAIASHKSIQLWIEKTRKGYHLWCFPEAATVKAKTMRRALMAVCKAAGYDPKEVNPKQEMLKHGQVGNYVRCPYPGGLTATERFFIDYTHIRHPVNLFEELDEAGRTPVDVLEDVAELWTPPPTHSVAFDIETSIDVREALRKANGLAFTIWEKGPLDGNDRSSTLAHLAHELIASNLSPSEAYRVLYNADERWGKFVARGDEHELEKLIELAVVTAGDVKGEV